MRMELELRTRSQLPAAAGRKRRARRLLISSCPYAGTLPLRKQSPILNSPVATEAGWLAAVKPGEQP